MQCDIPIPDSILSAILDETDINVINDFFSTVIKNKFSIPPKFYINFIDKISKEPQLCLNYILNINSTYGNASSREYPIPSKIFDGLFLDTRVLFQYVNTIYLQYNLPIPNNIYKKLLEMEQITNTWYFLKQMISNQPRTIDKIPEEILKEILKQISFSKGYLLQYIANIDMFGNTNQLKAIPSYVWESASYTENPDYQKTVFRLCHRADFDIPIEFLTGIGDAIMASRTIKYYLLAHPSVKTLPKGLTFLMNKFGYTLDNFIKTPTTEIRTESKINKFNELYSYYL
jgi:hypothetical protein